MLNMVESVHIASAWLKTFPILADWRSTLLNSSATCGIGSYKIYSKTAIYMKYGLVFSVFNLSWVGCAIGCSEALFINQLKLGVIRIHLFPPEYSRKTKD